MGGIDGIQLKMFCTCNDSIPSTREICNPNAIQEDDLEEFEEFEGEAVAGGKFIPGSWIYIIKLKDWKE